MLIKFKNFLVPLVRVNQQKMTSIAKLSSAAVPKVKLVIFNLIAAIKCC